MATQTLATRVDSLEERVTRLEELPARVDALTLQVSQLRDEMRVEFSAVRDEIRAGDEETRRTLRDEIRAGDEETTTAGRSATRFGLVDEEYARSWRKDGPRCSTRTRQARPERLHVRSCRARRPTSAANAQESRSST